MPRGKANHEQENPAISWTSVYTSWPKKLAITKGNGAGLVGLSLLSAELAKVTPRQIGRFGRDALALDQFRRFLHGLLDDAADFLGGDLREGAAAPSGTGDAKLTFGVHLGSIRTAGDLAIGVFFRDGA